MTSSEHNSLSGDAWAAFSYPPSNVDMEFIRVRVLYANLALYPTSGERNLYHRYAGLFVAIDGVRGVMQCSYLVSVLF
jgi:hypothetical protein